MELSAGIWYDFDLADEYCMAKNEDDWCYTILARHSDCNGNWWYYLVYRHPKDTNYPWHENHPRTNCYPSSKFDEFMIIPR